MFPHQINVTSLLILLLASQFVSAGTVRFEDYFPHPSTTSPEKDYSAGDLEFTDWGMGDANKYANVVLKLQKFDPRLGVLTSVQLEVEAQGKATGYLINNVDYTVTIRALQDITVEMDTSMIPALGSNLVVTHQNSEEFMDVKAGERVTLANFNEIARASLRTIDPVITGSFIDDSPTNPFLSHQIRFPVTADGDVRLGQNTGNLVNGVQTQAGAKGILTYGYINGGDICAEMNWNTDQDFKISMAVSSGESCRNYGFTVKMECSGGAGLEVGGYTLPAGCTATPSLNADSFSIQCESMTPLTATGDIYDFPNPSGNSGECSILVTQNSCNGTLLKTNELFSCSGDGGTGTDTSKVPVPIRIAHSGPVLVVPTLSSFGLILLVGLLGLLGFGRIHRD